MRKNLFGAFCLILMTVRRKRRRRKKSISLALVSLKEG